MPACLCLPLPCVSASCNVAKSNASWHNRTGTSAAAMQWGVSPFYFFCLCLVVGSSFGQKHDSTSLWQDPKTPNGSSSSSSVVQSYFNLLSTLRTTQSSTDFDWFGSNCNYQIFSSQFYLEIKTRRNKLLKDSRVIEEKASLSLSLQGE